MHNIAWLWSEAAERFTTLARTNSRLMAVNFGLALFFAVRVAAGRRPSARSCALVVVIAAAAAAATLNAIRIGHVDAAIVGGGVAVVFWPAIAWAAEQCRRP